MIKKGYKKEQLLPYGITVKHKFSKAIDKIKAREILHLQDNVFTIFVMYGGGFWSGNYNIVKNILRNIKDRQMQIIVANARDVKGKEKIEKLKKPSCVNLLNLGFVDNVELIMSASDIIIGKAGGLSTTEAVNIGLPIICCANLPEQEKANADMLVNEGAAKQYKNDKELITILRSLLNDPKQLVEMRENVKRIRRPYATKKVADEMMSCYCEYPEIEVDYDKVNDQIKNMLKKTKSK